MLNSQKDKDSVEIVLDKRKTTGLLLLSLTLTFTLCSYTQTLNTHDPLVLVSASDYAPTTPIPFDGSFIIGIIFISVAIIATIIFYFRDRILNFFA